MAWTTWTPQQGRHHAPIQSWIHPQTLLFGPSVLRALPVRQTGSRITPDISTKRIEPPLFGAMPHQSLGGALYFVSFLDDLTRKVWAYCIRTKDWVFSIFPDWLAMVENQTVEVSPNLNNSSNFSGNAAFDVNIRHPIVRNRTELLNA